MTLGPSGFFFFFLSLVCLFSRGVISESLCVVLLKLSYILSNIYHYFDISRLEAVSNFIMLQCYTFRLLCKIPLKCLLYSTIIKSKVYLLFLYQDLTAIIQL